MLKKAGILTVGVTAGLLAVAPIASAGEASVKGDSDHGHSRHHDDDNDHGKHHSKKHRKHDNGGDNRRCEFNAGDGRGEADTSASGLVATGTSAVNALGGSNTGNIGDCSDILSHNLDGNQLNLVTFGSDNER